MISMHEKSSINSSITQTRTYASIASPFSYLYVSKEKHACFMKIASATTVSCGRNNEIVTKVLQQYLRMIQTCYIPDRVQRDQLRPPPNTSGTMGVKYQV